MTFATTLRLTLLHRVRGNTPGCLVRVTLGRGRLRVRRRGRASWPARLGLHVVTLLRTVLSGIRNLPDPAVSEQVFAVIIDGLRPHPETNGELRASPDRQDHASHK